jgi:UPF0716 family protein affecting phage T7 exclusion
MALKPMLTYDILSGDSATYQEYSKNNYIYLGIYLLMVMIIQFAVNVSVISSSCGGNVTDNLGAAGFLTFIPWMLIFGVLIIILLVFPGFKSVFSDVIGYFYVSTQANKIITELLVNREVKDILEETPKASSSSPPLSQNQIGGGDEEKKKLEDAADAIVKICGNTSILINQIVPENFNDYWDILKPLMKDKYKDDTSKATIAKKTELFDIVVTRDNIGEAMWYIYTGLLLTSIVQLKISTRGCKSSPETMEKNYQEFLSKEEEAKAKKAEADNTVYTL